MPAAAELTLDQLAGALERLTPEEVGALTTILDKKNLKARWEMAKRELVEGKLISEEELFEDLACVG
jgi:hypothetical protein